MGPQWVLFRCHIHTLTLRSDFQIEARVLLIRTFILALISLMHHKAHTWEFLSLTPPSRICGKDLLLVSVIHKIWTTQGLWMPLNRKSRLLEVMLDYIQVKPYHILTSQLLALILALRRWKVTVTKVLWIGRVWIQGSKRFLALKIKATSEGFRKFKITKRPTPTLLQLSALTVFTRMLRHSMAPYMGSTSRKGKCCEYKRPIDSLLVALLFQRSRRTRKTGKLNESRYAA